MARRVHADAQAAGCGPADGGGYVSGVFRADHERGPWGVGGVEARDLGCQQRVVGDEHGAVKLGGQVVDGVRTGNGKVVMSASEQSLSICLSAQ